MLVAEALPPQYHIVRDHVVSESREDSLDSARREGRGKLYENSSVDKSLFSGSMVKLGEATYKFAKSINREVFLTENKWVCCTRDFNYTYTGYGNTPDEAAQDWVLNLHVDFQKLYAKRPFEMDGQEKTRWNNLVNTIDVKYYRVKTPIITREIGQVRFDMRSYPHSIKWISGKTDSIVLSQSPPELAKCKPGQWIEASLSRNPVSGHLVAIKSIQEIINFRDLSDKQLKEEWDSIPVADLPPIE